MSDNSFGPRLTGHFDFTLYFEHTLFHIVPAVVIILATPYYIHKIFRGTSIVRPGVLLCAKLVVAAALIGVQATIISLWSASPLEAKVADAAAGMSCASAVCIAIIVFVDHVYFIRPLPFLGFFLTVTILLDIATTITYFNRNSLDVIAGVYTSVPVLKLILLLLVEVSKRSLIRDKELCSSLTDEAFAGFWNRSLLVWVNSILLFGFRHKITADALPGLDADLDSEAMYRDFEHLWSTANKKSKRALLKVCVRLMPWQFSYLVLPRLMTVGFIFSQPFLLQDVVDAVSSQSPSPEVVRGLIIATTLVYVGKAISVTWYTTIRNRIITNVRGVLVAAIYHKSFRLSSAESVQSAAITLMSTDLLGIESLISLAYESWARVLEIGLGVGILAAFSGAAAVFTLIPTIISTVISTRLAHDLAINRGLWNKHIENRVATTSNMLAQMKEVKMIGLAPILAENLQKQAEDEVDISMKDRNAMAGAHTLTALAETVTPVLVIAATMFWTRASEPLSPARFFTTLAFVTIVTNPLSELLRTAPIWATGFASLSRVQDFLCLEEVKDQRQYAVEGSTPGTFSATNVVTLADNTAATSAVNPAPSPTPNATTGGTSLRNRQESSPVVAAVEVMNISVTMDMTGSVLRNVSIGIPIGCTTMIVGKVGCGKSTFLKSLIGQMKLRSGSVSLASKIVAYSAQQPWIRNTTIRDNVIGCRPYRPAIYRRVMYLCALDVDMAQLADGDQTMAGTDGCNLSGGQKQRISLARALYVEADVLVLDDPFSSLDMETSSTIRIRLFGEGGITERGLTTVVMTTSMKQHLVDADAVLLIDDNGRVGLAPSNYADTDSTTTAPITTLPAIQGSAQGLDGDEKFEHEYPAVKPAASGDADHGALEGTQYGDLSLWRYFLGPAGAYSIIWVMAVVCVGALVERLPQIFVKLWLDHNSSSRVFFAGYAVLGLANPVVNYIGSMVFYYLLVGKASKALHQRLVSATTKATFDFIAEEDAGAILNRFGPDTTTATQRLPQWILPTAWIGGLVLIDIGIIAAGASYASPIIPFFLLVIFFVQYFYLRTSRQVRATELDSSKYLVRQFSETSKGLEHIRAFQWEKEFSREFFEILHYTQKPFYLLYCIQQWLETVMNLSTAAGAVGVVSLALNFTHTTSATAMGLALLSLITFSETMGNFIICVVSTETSYTGVARIRAFTDKAPVEMHDGDGSDLPDQWPQNGMIVFNGVSAVYKQHSASPRRALEHVTVAVQPGQTIGLIGRTGSGKSTVLLSLLRLLEYSGSITIDDRELKTVPHDLLRSRIMTITQSGLELMATVRFNIDPFRFTAGPEASPNDDTLAGILRRVGLWTLIARRGGLDAPMSEMKLSHGQRQLFQLARAILQRQVTGSRVLLIDEGTSSMDEVTEQRMNALMNEIFVGCTRVVISHRQNTLNNAHVVLRLTNGIAEVFRGGAA